MSTKIPFPAFDERLSFLNDFIIDGVETYKAGKIDSWRKLDRIVKDYFTPERTEHMEKLIPGWENMASFSNGITQTHVICVFLGVYILPEFQALSLVEQQLAKWIVLFHDLAKVHLPKKRDAMHGFRSGILVAQILPSLGFPITEKYHEQLESWSEFTSNAYYESDIAPIPDNQKLPEILMGIDRMFGVNAPASRIVKIVLLHISLTIDPNYQSPAPLTDDEIKRYITPELYPLLKVMMMGDIEGWSLFKPQVRKQQYHDAIEAFNKVYKIIAGI